MMTLVPVKLKKLNAYIEDNHRHHGRIRTDFFRVGCQVDERLAGVVSAGLPNAPMLCKKPTCCEVTRLCTDMTHSAGSLLLGAIVRAGLSLGYRRFVSYTRVDELGTVYRAANWWPVACVKGREWNTGNKRSRKGRKPSTEIIDRIRWECGPEAAPENPKLAHLGRRTKG